MQAVVLAGGKGTRLRPLTYTVPKPLLPVMGRPLIDHLVARLPRAVDEILLTVSYMAEDLREWADTADDPALHGRTLHIIEETEPLGTAGAVANCADQLDDTFFVMNGDLVSDVDFVDLLSFHDAQRGLGTIALYEVDDPSRFGVVDQDDAGRIRRFVEKPSPAEAPSNMVNAGAYILEPEVLDLIPRGRAVSIEREVFPQVADTNRGLWGRAFRGLWIDCGTPDSYLEVHRLLLEREGVPFRVGPQTQVADVGLDAEAVFLGRGVEVGPAARLRDVVVHDGAVIGAKARLERCIIGPGAVVGAGAVLSEVVLGPGERVAADEHLEGTRRGMREEI